MKTDSNLPSPKITRWTGIKRKIRKVFFIFLTLIFVILFFFIYWRYFYTYSNGYRAGLLQKFSHKGNIFKTFEGEMILSSVSSNTNVVIASEKFNFSVVNKSLARQLDTIQGQMVIVHYKQKNGVLFWQGDSQYLVDSVKRIR